MLIYEYKLDGSKHTYAAIDEAIRITQFIRNKCWLNSQARQASADRAWCAISRFYEHCKQKKPGKKGYPRFQHDNRSVEYKTTGWVRFVCSKTAKRGRNSNGSLFR